MPRTLKFIVTDQTIIQDPKCDFDGLVPGTAGYLRAEFTFSPSWNGCVKIASFSSMLGAEYPPEILKDGKSCMIPAEALKKKAFKLRVIGKKDGWRITTDKITVKQNGGKR